MRFALLAAAFCLPLLAQDKKPEPKKADEKKLPRIAINDPAKLKDDADYKIQGEFVGSTPNLKFAFQVIARGEGNFDIVGFMGGLPGDGGGDALPKTGTAKSVDGKVVLDTGGFIQDNVLQVGKGLQESGKRIDRNSPTTGAEPPDGARVLFNKPEDLAKWEKTKTVKLSDGEFLGVGGRTIQKFQSFTLHLEFRLPWMPNSRGQARANSGVYLQDRYELQVLDSFGLKGENNECGGFYQIAAPKVNMCFPPMSWQTYDIDFTAAKFEDGKKTSNAVVTVKHNGVVIHDKLELKNKTPGGAFDKESPEPGSLYIQDHSDPVMYRNIWIVEKK